MDRATAVIKVLGIAAVPAFAFAVRMVQGNTRNEHEQVISEWVRETLKHRKEVQE